MFAFQFDVAAHWQAWAIPATGVATAGLVLLMGRLAYGWRRRAHPAVPTLPLSPTADQPSRREIRTTDIRSIEMDSVWR